MVLSTPLHPMTEPTHLFTWLLISGDNNDMDDRVLYNYGQNWLEKKHILGKAIG